jgi:hypothetical protein
VFFISVVVGDEEVTQMFLTLLWLIVPLLAAAIVAVERHNQAKTWE